MLFQPAEISTCICLDNSCWISVNFEKQNKFLHGIWWLKVPTCKPKSQGWNIIKNYSYAQQQYAVCTAAMDETIEKNVVKCTCGVSNTKICVPKKTIVRVWARQISPEAYKTRIFVQIFSTKGDRKSLTRITDQNHWPE